MRWANMIANGHAMEDERRWKFAYRHCRTTCTHTRARAQASKQASKHAKEPQVHKNIYYKISSDKEAHAPTTMAVRAPPAMGIKPQNNVSFALFTTNDSFSFAS